MSSKSASQERPAKRLRTASAKIVSWNVNGVRAFVNRAEQRKAESSASDSSSSCASRLTEFILEEDPDIVCLQETKIDESLEEQFSDLLGKAYPHKAFSSSKTKKGYAGTAVFSKKRPISVRTDAMQSGAKQASDEGRCIVCEFEDFVLVNTYVPNSGMKLERLNYRTKVWDPAMVSLLKELDAGAKGVVWTGDLNVAHGDEDVAFPKKKRNKVPG